jgi:hypothetical protein
MKYNIANLLIRLGYKTWVEYANGNNIVDIHAEKEGETDINIELVKSWKPTYLLVKIKGDISNENVPIDYGHNDINKIRQCAACNSTKTYGPCWYSNIIKGKWVCGKCYSRLRHKRRN